MVITFRGWRQRLTHRRKARRVARQIDYRSREMPTARTLTASDPARAARRLIVNADDFGQDVAVNAGILAAHREGIVTSATIMAVGTALVDAAARLREAPGLGIGCHIVLVDGLPAAPPGDVRSLLDAAGRLPCDLPRFFWNLSARAKDAELKLEIRAQIDRLRAHGVAPGHCDSHKHTHAHPRVAAALFEIAAAQGIPAVRQPFEHGEPAARPGRTRRIRSLLAATMRRFEAPFRRSLAAHRLTAPAHFRGFTLSGTLDADALLRVLASLAPGLTEFMCHPAAGAVRLGRGPEAHARRARELAALTDLRVRDHLSKERITLTTFAELGAEP